MKKAIAIMMTLALTLTLLTGCGGGSGSDTPSSGEGPLRIGYLTENLGDNAANDDAHEGVQRYAAEHDNVELTVVETTELQDYDINARSMASEGYHLILVSTPTASEIIGALAPDYPDTQFIIGEGTIDGQENVSCWNTLVAEAGFLTGAFNALMNQELGGPMKAVFVGGVRNPGLERAQYGFTAGAEYVGGTGVAVYVGSFTDVAKGKELAMQMYQDDMKLMQAYAGGAGMGIYQAAESLPEGYYALGAANGQFHLSDRIIASQVKLGGDIFYSCIEQFAEGTLPQGIFDMGIVDGAVDFQIAPGKEDLIPQEIKDQIDELREKIISGEIVPPSTEAEYNAFKA